MTISFPQSAEVKYALFLTPTACKSQCRTPLRGIKKKFVCVGGTHTYVRTASYPTVSTIRPANVESAADLSVKLNLNSIPLYRTKQKRGRTLRAGLDLVLTADDVLPLLKQRLLQVQ
jgi:hypothetical protein